MTRNPPFSRLVFLSASSAKRAAQYVSLGALSFWICLACDEEKPETPFQVASSLPRDRESPPKPPPEEPATGRRAVSQLAPRNASSWKVFDRTLAAPRGTFLRAAIPIPASESDEILVLVTPRPKEGSLEGAGLWRADQSGKLVERVMPHPEFLPSGKDCRYTPSLEATGKHSVSVRLRSACSTRLLPGTPIEALWVVAPQAEDQVLVKLRTLEAAPGESIALSIDSSDQDRDGFDDVVLSVTLRAPDGTEETLPFTWLYRPAGASRQSDEPAKSLAKRAARLSISAVRKAERDRVLPQVRALRRLLSTLCSEFSTARLQRHNGEALKCGDLGESLFRLTHSAVQAELGAGRPGSALGLAERADWIGGKLDEKEKKSLALLLLEKIPTSSGRRLARFDSRAASLSTAYASPLHFDELGQLWLKDPQGKVKRLTMKGDPPLVIPKTKDSPEKVIRAPSWDLELKGPGDKRLSAALPSCQRSEVQLAFSRPAGTPPTPVPVPLLAPRPGNCRNYAGFDLRAEPIAWSAGHLSVILGGELIRSGGHPRAPQRPVAWATELGLAVQKGDQLRLWKDISVDGAHHCVASWGAEKVACIKGDSVYVYSASPTSDAPKTRAPAE